MSRLRIVSIDPGFTGAVAVSTYYPDTKDFKLEHLGDMPLINPKDPRTKRIDTVALMTMMECRLSLVDRIPRVLIIEEQHSRPRDGSASAFKNGRNYGVLLTLADIGGYRDVHIVDPGWWKSRVGLTSDKTFSRQTASAIYPEFKYMFKRVSDHDRAEAAMLGRVYPYLNGSR